MVARLGLPVEIAVRPPSFISATQLIAGVGTAGGLLFGDFMGALITTASGLTGTGALAVSIFTKAALGTGLFYITKSLVVGRGKVFGWFASVGCMTSIIVDFIRAAWPGGAVAAGASAGARLRGRPVIRLGGAGLRASITPGTVSPGVTPPEAGTIAIAPGEAPSLML